MLTNAAACTLDVAAHCLAVLLREQHSPDRGRGPVRFGLPHMAEVFREKVTTLAAGLEHDNHPEAARQAVRGLMESIIIPPGDGLLQVTGNLGAMLATAAGQKMPRREAVANVGCGG